MAMPVITLELAEVVHEMIEMNQLNSIRTLRWVRILLNINATEAKAIIDKVSTFYSSVKNRP